MTSKQGVATPAPENQIKQQQLLQRYNAWKPKFPNVVAIDVLALRQLIDEDRQQTGSPKVVLVDVRAPAEQEVCVYPLYLTYAGPGHCLQPDQSSLAGYAMFIC